MKFKMFPVMITTKNEILVFITLLYEAPFKLRKLPLIMRVS